MFDTISYGRILKVVSRGYWLLFPFVLAVYLYTMAPTVGLIDSGELATGCYFLNILHPTGYPLYTIIGHLSSIVPVGSVANRTAGLSAVFGAAGIGLFFLLLRFMGVGMAAGFGTALVLAFSHTVWSVSVDVEVYAFTLVLAVLVWITVARRYLLLFGYAAGLVLTNHMSAVSVILGAGLALVLEEGKYVRRRVPAMVLLFMLGLSPYLFLVLRARAGPLLAWGNPVNLERFFWHVTGKQYQVWMFSLPFSEVMENAGKGLLLLARSFVYVLVPVVFYGAFRLFRLRRNLAIGLGVTALLSFLYAINYSIPDIEAYYIPGILALAVFCAVGLDGIARRVGRWRHLLWVPGVLALVFNFSGASRRGDYVAYDQAMNTLASAEKNAIIMTDWWDLHAPVFYLQHVEYVRPDVCIIDKELVRRSWYFNYLAEEYPWLIKNSRSELERYLGFLDRFEHGRLHDQVGIQHAFIRLLESFAVNNPDRPAYTTFAWDASPDAKQMFRSYRWVPVGILFQVRTDTIVPEFNYSKLKVRPSPRSDMRTQANLEHYGFFAQRRIQALRARTRNKEAQAVLRWYQSIR